MTKVRVHPHRTMVKAGEEACVSITPARPRARAYYMGTVMMKNVTFSIQPSGLKRAQDEQVRNVHALAVGDLISEFTEQYPLTPKALKHMRKVTYHYNIGRFITTDDGTDVTDGQFDAAYVVGRDFYVSEF